MKKRGFTLAEILIALGVIGVISAFMIPAIGYAKPDKTKIVYLKAYDSLTQAVKTLTNDSSIYTSTYIKQNAKEKQGCQENNLTLMMTCQYNYYNLTYDVSKYPLFDFSKPLNSQFNDSANQGNMKFARLLSSVLGGTDLNCTSSLCSFRTKNVSWSVVPNNAQKTLLNPGRDYETAEFYNIVMMNINDERFKAYIYADGTVEPADIKSQAYLKNRKSVKLNDADMENLTAKVPEESKYKISVGGNGSGIVRLSEVAAGSGEETEPMSMAVDQNDRTFDQEISKPILD